MSPYAELVSGVIEAKTLRKRDAAMRKSATWRVGSRWAGAL